MSSQRQQSPPPPAAAGGAPSWCLKELGLDRGADATEARKAYLQRVRETHPDKGGNSDEFRRVVCAIEAFAGSPGEVAPEVPKTAPASARGSSKFTLDDLKKLAEEVRQLHVDRVRAERKEADARQSAVEKRRQSAQQRASLIKEQEEAGRMERALRLQRRHTMPAGVELCPKPAGSVSTGEFFRAQVELKGTFRFGPHRRTIDAAELDLDRLQRAAGQSGDPGVTREVRRLQQESRSRWK